MEWVGAIIPLLSHGKLSAFAHRDQESTAPNIHDITQSTDQICKNDKVIYGHSGYLKIGKLLKRDSPFF